MNTLVIIAGCIAICIALTISHGLIYLKGKKDDRKQMLERYGRGGAVQGFGQKG